MRTENGYDYIAITKGDRIELHPGTDLWMRGARFGEVVGFVSTSPGRVKITLDKFSKRRVFTVDANLIRKVS